MFLGEDATAPSKLCQFFPRHPRQPPLWLGCLPITAKHPPRELHPPAPPHITANAAPQSETWGTKAKAGVEYRLLLSAHGLPKRTIAKGDPYQWQVEQTAKAIVDALGMENLDWSVCYQSRVGPLEWIGPATDAEIRRAAADGKGLIIAPIAFVSEHSETLVELDIEYAHLAASIGVVDYLRVPTVGSHPAFIAALADLVMQAAGSRVTIGEAGGCPSMFGTCPCRER